MAEEFNNPTGNFFNPTLVLLDPNLHCDNFFKFLTVVADGGMDGLMDRLTLLLDASKSKDIKEKIKRYFYH